MGRESTTLGIRRPGFKAQSHPSLLKWEGTNSALSFQTFQGNSGQTPFHGCSLHSGTTSCPRECCQGISSSNRLPHLNQAAGEEQLEMSVSPYGGTHFCINGFLKLSSLGWRYTAGKEKHASPCPLVKQLSPIFLSLSPSPVHGMKVDDGLGFLRISFSKS